MAYYTFLYYTSSLILRIPRNSNTNHLGPIFRSGTSTSKDTVPISKHVHDANQKAV